MEIATPKEPVYYYECSAGRFRLVYFIPPGELQRLRDRGQLSNLAIRDLPDGVDIGCTDPDFSEFEELYGYRPPNDPEALQRAFFAIFIHNPQVKDVSWLRFHPRCGSRDADRDGRDGAGKRGSGARHHGTPTCARDPEAAPQCRTST